MLRKTSMGVLFSALCFLPFQAYASSVFINEFHYDNAGGDVGEAIELAGVAGIDLSDWQLLFYNGSNGSVYKTVALNGIFSNQANGYGFLSFHVTGIQNGSPDGVALVDDTDSVLQFISYEGSFAATSGLAASLLSEDIGIREDSATALNQSLQMTGFGLLTEDFSWILADSTFGMVNVKQEFSPSSQSVAVVPIPGVAPLMLPMLLWMYRMAS